MKYYFLLVEIVVLVALGFYLDSLQAISEEQLRAGFYFAGLMGILMALVVMFKHLNTTWSKVLILLVALLVWRISYFSIMVLAGFVAGFWESAYLTLFSHSSIYPAFLLIMAIMNAVAVLLAGYSVLALTRLIKAPIKVLLPITVLLGTIATTLSFIHPFDWKWSPENNLLADTTLPQPHLPEYNPYEVALQQPNINWRQKVLFIAASITYKLIPSNTVWSQEVKGTMEVEFHGNESATTAMCTKIHYRAFQAAQASLHRR